MDHEIPSTGDAPGRALQEVICQALPAALALARHFERFYSRPYLDPIGRATVGYGTTFYPNGRAVTLSDSSLTESQAANLLLHFMSRTALAIQSLMIPQITPGRLASLSDFAYNVGLKRACASTLFLKLRSTSTGWQIAPSELRKWTLAGGRRLDGLRKRREAEILLI